jgi:ribosome modulation factor
MSDTQAASAEDEDRFGLAFMKGQADYADGCDEMNNPYDDADKRAAWEVGWETAKNDGSLANQ